MEVERPKKQRKAGTCHRCGQKYIAYAKLRTVCYCGGLVVWSEK